MTERGKAYLGTYFDRDGVLRWSRVIGILGWVVAGIYAADLLLGLAVMGLQSARGFLVGMGPTDWMQQVLFILERTVHGVLYFGLLHAISKGLLIALDVEENTRRAARP